LSNETFKTCVGKQNKQKFDAASIFDPDQA